MCKVMKKIHAAQHKGEKKHERNAYIAKLVVLSQLPAIALILEANRCIVGDPNSNSNT